MPREYLGSSFSLDKAQAELNPQYDFFSSEDPDLFRAKLQEISSPRERLSLFLRSVFIPWTPCTHESEQVRNLFIYGFLTGSFAGFLMNYTTFTAEWVRKYNASVFEGKHRSQRHKIDHLISAGSAKSLKTGIPCSLLSGLAGVIAYGSISYRGDLYICDWLVGFTALGAASRLWIGPKATFAGGVLGLAAGFTGYGLAKATEMITGLSTPQIRYERHRLYLQSIDEKRSWTRSLQESNTKEKLDSAAG